MSQGGEFAFVLYATAAGLDIISGEQNSRMTAGIVVSMAFTPLFIALKNALYRPRTTDAQEIEIEEPQPIILIGMGRYGQIVRQLLWSAGYRATILDLNAKMVEGFTRFGVKAYFGDATRPELLRTAGIEQAKLLIIAIDNPEKTLQITEFAQKINPNIRIVARAFDRMHSYQLYEKGVQKVMRETFASSVQTGKQALEMLGMEAKLAAEVGDLYARINQDGMKAIAALYDPAVPAFRNEALNEVVRNQERRMYEEIQALLTAAQAEEEAG